MRELRDISEMEDPDMAAIQRKISAGGEMKTAIKRFLESWDGWEAGMGRMEPHPPKGVRQRTKELRKAMEGWCNA